jgi:hypothetical protein
VKARLLAAALLAAAFTAPAAHAATAPAPSQMAVLTADSGTLRGSVLTLRGVSPTATWFDDRPFRAAGVQSTWRLVPAYFAASSPPNAAIELAGRRGKADTLIVELKHPSIDAKRHTLRFTARVLPDTGEGLRAWDARKVDVAPPAFGHATVFLDSLTQSCGADVTLPTGVIATGGTVSSAYGGDVMLNYSQLASGYNQNVFRQSGGGTTGCGATLTYQLQQAGTDGQPLAGGQTGTLTLNWTNPTFGSDNASCTSTYPGVTCAVPEAHGESVHWTFQNFT